MTNEKMLFVVDLDGTLADNTHRQHLVPTGDNRGSTQGWAEFNKACAEDTEILTTVELISALESFYAGARARDLIVLTGRGEESRPETEEWLASHGWDFDEVLMREVGDYRKAADFKVSTLQCHIRKGKYTQVVAFEDDITVVGAFQKMGVFCIAVPHSDAGLCQG